MSSGPPPPNTEPWNTERQGTSPASVPPNCRKASKDPVTPGRAERPGRKTEQTSYEESDWKCSSPNDRN